MEAFAATYASIQQRINALLTVVRQIARAAWVDLYAPQHGWNHRFVEMSPAERETANWLAHQVLSTGQIIVIDDVQKLPKAQRHVTETTAQGSNNLLRYYAGFPIGQPPLTLGVLSVATRESYMLTPEQKQAIAVLGNEIGNLLRSTSPDLSGRSDAHSGATPAAQVSASYEQLPLTACQSLMHLSMTLQRCLTFEDLKYQLIKLLPTELPILAFELMLTAGKHSPQEICLWPAAQVQTSGQDELECHILQHHDASVLSNLPSLLPEERAVGLAQTPDAPKIQWRCYQLKVQNRNIGTLKLCLKPEAASRLPAESEILNHVADQIGITLHRLVLLRKLQAENLQDPLTKLFNRRHMMGILNKLMQRVSYGHYQVGLIMLDLDHFKRLNDTYGHDTGDQVLCMIGLFLKGYARPNDVVCRYGGEEFALILPGLTWEILERRAQQLCRSIRYLSLKSGDTPLQITLSAGFAIAPRHAETPATLIKAADQALYEAKRQGRNRAIGAPFTQEKAT